MSDKKPIHVVGGGLAGSEAAWAIADRGLPVVLHEMRPQRMTDAHKSDGLAELVCSNSLRSDDAENNAVGLLHADWVSVASVAGMAGVVSLLTSVGSAEATDGSPSLTTETLPRRAQD